MSLKKYEAFVRTVELGSLTKAAEAMGSTQSRISHVLSALEEEYGFVLLRRNRSGVRLTEAGEMVLPKMQEILQKDRELTELIGDIRSADAGTVRLGAFTSVAVHWLPGMIRTFQSAHPKAELKMFNGDYHDMEQWLREGEVDIGFVTLPAPEGMRTIPLTQDPLVAIMPKNHRLAQLDEIPIQELGEDPFISLLLTISTGRWIMPVCARTSNLPPRTTMPFWPWWSRGWAFPSFPSCSSRAEPRIWRFVR